MKESDAKTVYGDIIGLPHRQSATRKHMSLYDRAAQFASYKALSGYEDMVIEEARLTSSEIELSEIDMEMLNQKVWLLCELLAAGQHPRIALTYFKPDAFKAGGEYVTISGFLKKIDDVDKKIILYGSDNIEDKTIPPIEIAIGKVIAMDIDPAEDR
ncbi:MAG: hypothetical protein IJH07_08300 [Ruminococcus sp.]|nr:hypothetical protein [Ruminococcus sp.]